MNANEKGTVPLPAPPAADERATVPLPGLDAETTPRHPKPDTLGRFVVRGFLGAGAFGDVYRAFDPTLDREVALKVAKPCSLNTPERLQRFLREAKAAANLRHPHIVPLYETGQDGDRRFIASAFIDGQTLEATLAGSDVRLPLHTVAAIGRKLADALAYAHSQGVVHRDVKPANVLVDAAGEPHLLDFGLAARAEAGDEKLTQDGQGMGTPAYMAPEQADGNGIAASDQYSLGCTLYELAAGRTPFAGGSAQQMFLHRTQPVPSPRSVRKDIPKDLDTLILKCLEKEPARRYPSCSDLSDDLRRFASGEPVKVRRAGPVERFTRWAKRNKRLAGMGLLVLLTMALGTGFSLGFGLYANEQAGIAKGETKRANDETQKKEAEARRANEKTEEARRELARSILRPISLSLDEPSEYERNALWQLAALRQSSLPSLVLEEATDSELTAAQYRHRAVDLDHAAIGLDSRKRGEADALVAQRVMDKSITPGHRRELALATFRTERYAAVEELAEVLATALVTASHRDERREFVAGLSAVAARLSADNTGEVCGKAAEKLLTAWLKEPESFNEGGVVEWLSAVAVHLPAEMGVKVLLAAQERTTEVRVRQLLGKEVSAVAARLPVDTATEALLAALGKATSGSERRELAIGLSAVLSRLSAGRWEAGDRAAEALLTALGKATGRDEWGVLTEGLAAVATCLPADKAGEVCGRAAETLLTALGKVMFTNERRKLAEGLAAVAARLSADKAGEVCGRAAKTLLSVLEKETSAFEREELAIGLSAVAARLPADQVGEVCGKAADVLVTALKKTTNTNERCAFAAGLASVAAHLPASTTADTLIATLERATGAGERRELAAGLAAVAARLPADKAGEVCGRAAEMLITALDTPTSAFEREELAIGLSAMAARLPAGNVELRGRVVETLLTAQGKATNANEWGALAVATSAVAARLPADRAADVCGRAAEALLTALGNGKFVMQDKLVVGLLAVAARLPADKIAELLPTAMESMRDARVRHLLAEGLLEASGFPPRLLAQRKPAEKFVALPGVTALHSAVLPKPHLLPPQHLVELLKHPFCVKEARRAVLDALEFTYDRPFADLWEFVAFAEKAHPELDLLTPPKRPEKVVPPAARQAK